ncbi:MAG: DUF2306 domain-containing protein [Pseudomonadota bacterium]
MPVMILKKTVCFFQSILHAFKAGGPYWGGMTCVILIASMLPVYYLSRPALYSNTKFASLFFETYLYNNILLGLHIAFSLLALVMGPWLFNTTLRKKYPDLHRKLGKFYVLGCFFGAITVFPLAIRNIAGPIAHIGFGMMAVLWFLVTYYAYTAILNKDFIAHRRWMMRSYAMTFAFIHVNITFSFFLPYATLSLQGVQAFQSMVSWQVNLLLVEVYLAATSHTGRFLGYRKWRDNLLSFNLSRDHMYFLPVRPLHLNSSKNRLF